MTTIGVSMPSDTLATFGCSTCGTDLGWTAPGESKRIGQRARVYCDECKDRPEDLTARQAEFVNLAAEHYRATGTKASLTLLAEKMGISRSRAQQLRDVIRRRRPGLLENGDNVVVTLPRPGETTADTIERHVKAQYGTDGSGQPVTAADQAAWQDDPNIVAPKPTGEFVAPQADNPDTADPAAGPGEFV